MSEISTPSDFASVGWTGGGIDSDSSIKRKPNRTTYNMALCPTFSTASDTFIVSGAGFPGITNIFLGGGSGGIQVASGSSLSGQKIFFNMPFTNTISGNTSACRMDTNRTWVGNQHISVTVNTVRPIRVGPPTPNSWECFWLIYQAVDNDHAYYSIHQKLSGGLEFGKNDTAGQQVQQILYTPALVSGASILTPNTWHTWDVYIKSISGGATVSGSAMQYTFYCDNLQIGQFNEYSGSINYNTTPGKVTLYCEDAYTQVSNFSVETQ